MISRNRSRLSLTDAFQAAADERSYFQKRPDRAWLSAICRSTNRCAPSIMRPDRSSSGQSSAVVCGSGPADAGTCMAGGFHAALDPI